MSTDLTKAHVGDAIRRERQAKGLSIKVLASKAGVSPKSLNRIELGQGNPGFTALLALSKALGITFKDLVYAAEDEAARHGECGLTPEEFREHFGHLPTDGEG